MDYAIVLILMGIFFQNNWKMFYKNQPISKAAALCLIGCIAAIVIHTV